MKRFVLRTFCAKLALFTEVSQQAASRTIMIR